MDYDRIGKFYPIWESVSGHCEIGLETDIIRYPSPLISHEIRFEPYQEAIIQCPDGQYTVYHVDFLLQEHKKVIGLPDPIDSIIVRYSLTVADCRALILYNDTEYHHGAIVTEALVCLWEQEGFHDN
jgi:hypothetical protein